MTLDSLKDIVSRFEKETQDSGHSVLITEIGYQYYVVGIGIEYVDRNTDKRHTVNYCVPSNAYNV